MDRFQYRLPYSLRGSVQNQQSLLIPANTTDDRCNQSPPHRQLIDPGLRNSLPTRGSDDARIRRTFGIARHAITKQQMQIGQTQKSLRSRTLAMSSGIAFAQVRQA